jgi:thiamine biosynthesis protein ThiS
VTKTHPITVNGKPLDVPEGTTVADLLDSLDISRQGTAVERNRVIVPRSLHTEARIEAGDRIEIVTAVGGG